MFVMSHYKQTNNRKGDQENALDPNCLPMGGKKDTRYVSRQRSLPYCSVKKPQKPVGPSHQDTPEPKASQEEEAKPTNLSSCSLFLLPGL